MRTAIIGSVVLVGQVLGQGFIFGAFDGDNLTPKTACAAASAEFVCTDAATNQKTCFAANDAPTATWLTPADLTQCFAEVADTSALVDPTSCKADGASCQCHEWVTLTTTTTLAPTGQEVKATTPTGKGLKATAPGLVQAVSTDDTEWTAYVAAAATAGYTAGKCLFPYFIGDYPVHADGVTLGNYVLATGGAAVAANPSACQTACIAVADSACVFWTFTVDLLDGTNNCFFQTQAAIEELTSGVVGDGTCAFVAGTDPVTVSTSGANLCSVATGRGVSGMRLCNGVVYDFAWQDANCVYATTTTSSTEAGDTTIDGDGTVATESTAPGAVTTGAATTTTTTGTGTTTNNTITTPAAAAAMPMISGVLLAAMSTGLVMYTSL